MNVTLIGMTTEKPLSFVGQVAGMSYGKQDQSPKRAASCFKLGHMSVFEHVSVTFRVEGISRACSHQLVRHRMASYCQVSQRYTRIDKEAIEAGSWYVKPAAMEVFDDSVNTFEDLMRQMGQNYLAALSKGAKPEDARHLLPEATKTNLNVTMNLREFVSFWELRTDPHAQWEIRELAEAMADELYSLGGEWGEFVEIALPKHGNLG